MTQALTTNDHVVVVGAGLAGWRFVEALRREGYEGALTLVGDETHAPYDRPPLSKQVLSGKWPSDKATLATPELLDAANLTWRRGDAAVSLDVDACRVRLANGDDIVGTRVVIATGTRARQLTYSAGDEVCYLRTISDAQRVVELAASLEPGATVVIIGGGFIGAEVATSLKNRGLTPVVLEALVRPLVSVLGDEASAWLAHLPSDFGIEVRTNQVINDVSGVVGSFVVSTNDGHIDASLVVLGVGAVPTTQWLESSTLAIINGVVTDEYLMAAPNVGALGDVARFRWRHDPFDEAVRIEHWQVANDHALYLAHAWTSEQSSPLSIVPYFWSDQYGRKIQMLGHPAPSDDVQQVAGVKGEGKWLALYSREGIVTGALALNQPRDLMLSRALVEHHVTLDDALASSPWVTSKTQ